MFQQRRMLGTLALCAVIILTSVAAVCSKQSFISNARTAFQSYQDAEPLFKQLGIPTQRLGLVVAIANDLVIAFEQNQNEAALLLVSALIKRTNEIIAEDVSLIKNEGDRVRVMAVLALANIALHWIANNLIKVVSESQDVQRARVGAVSSDILGALSEVEAFAKVEPWGRKYVH